MMDEDERLRRASDALRAKLDGPDADFTRRVMERVRAEPAPRRAPRRIEVPRWSIPLAAAAMLAMWFAGTRFGASHAVGTAPAVAVAPSPARNDTVYVRFEISAPSAQQVHLAGDFSGWQPNVQLVKSNAGTWVATVPVAVGVHRYQFVVDDSWVPDPAVGGVDDGFGGRNSVMVVGPKGVVRS
jgi:negative regulator of sigma E activity